MGGTNAGTGGSVGGSGGGRASDVSGRGGLGVSS